MLANCVLLKYYPRHLPQDICPRDGMVDITDLKSVERKLMPVQVRPWVPNIFLFAIKLSKLFGNEKYKIKFGQGDRSS